MYKSVKDEMLGARRRKDWRRLYGLAWCYGLMTRREAEKAYFQRHMIITLKGNYVSI